MLSSRLSYINFLLFLLSQLGHLKADVVRQTFGGSNSRPISGIPQNQRPNYNYGISCYVQAPGSPRETTKQCGGSGCIKRVLYEENGREVIEKRCGDIERNEFDYNEGCETIKVPFKNKVCYCKTSLCNGASTFADTFYSLKLAMTLICIYFLNNFY